MFRGVRAGRALEWQILVPNFPELRDAAQNKLLQNATKVLLLQSSRF
jgi:hypothetical protein